MRSKKQTLVSVVSPRQNGWQKIRRALVVPLVALGMFAGLLFLLNQPVEMAAAAVQPTLATENPATEAPNERAPQANILYVTADGSGTACTIAQPCKIQDAVNAAATGDEIHVAAGIHDDVVGNGTFTQTVQINKNVTLRGGYTTTNWLADPDPVANETILDGLNQGRVIRIFAAAPTIEGFTIRNGVATFGAGIYKQTLQGSVIRNNRIYANSAIGGAESGGGIYTQGADTIVDNEIFDNFANASGGGIYVTTNGGTPIIQNNRIYDNTSGTAGGSGRGGGIYIFTGQATVEGNVFYGNVSNFGGGLSVGVGGNVLIQNNIFYNNQATYHIASAGAGGAIQVSEQATIVHNTLVDNQAPTAMGGGLAVTSASAVVGITNTIVVSNTALSNSGIFNNGTTSGSHNNLFNNSSNATLNATIAGSPRFADYAGDDFHLSANSTNVVDVALNAGVISDVDGQIRPFGLGYDVGADEFYDPALTCFARVNDGPLFTSIQSAIATVTQASDVVKVAGLCRDTDNEVVLINQSLILRGGYTTTDWVNQTYGPTIIDAQGVSGRRGILITGGSPTIDALHITGGNLPSTNGSAVFVSGGTGAVLQNLVLYGNTTGGATNGALGVASLTNPDIQFNTIVNNTGNGVRFVGTGAIHNSILYNNTGTPISGGAGHTFNLIGVNPLFVNAAANDYHLTAQSPAIGAANPNASLSRDFEGDTRPRGNHFDAGADEANEYPAPSFEPNYTDEVERDTTVTIDHSLTNLGTQPDTFSLTGSNNLGWAIDFPTTSGLLLPGESLQVMVVITVPAGALPQQVGVTVITATSAINTNVKDTVVDTITVAQIPGIAFTPTYSNSLLPGEAITYTHLLTNTGDYTDTITVELVNDPFGWAELLPDDPFDVVLASGQITPVVVVVTVPPNAAAGFANTIIIRATSNYEPSVTAAVTDTVTAKPTVGTRYVSNAGFDLNNNCTQSLQPCLTVKQAVSQASFGDQIRIAPGTYAEADITVNDTMALSGGWTNNFTAQIIDPTLTVIDAAQLARVFTIAPGTQPAFGNLTIQNGLSSVVGGGVWIGNGAQPTFTGVHFRNNQGSQGGAIYAEANTNVRLWDSWFEGNTATRNGGGFFMVSGNALISATTFLDNGAGGSQSLEGGGAIYQQGGNLTVINSLLADNSSAQHGGAIFARGGTATVDFVTVVGNAAAGSGGAVYNDNAVTTLTNAIFSDNTSVTGGALFNNTGTIPNNYDLFWNNLPNNGNVTLGANSVLGNPDYADAAYRLSPNSEAVDNGDPATTLEIDFEGDTRPADSGFDIGYDELAGCLAQRGTVIYASIQEAIDAGVGGNLIRVSGICRGAQGVDIGGGVIVSQTVYLDEPLEIEGGWNSSFSSNDPLVPTFIDPQGVGRGFYITGADGAIIRSLILVNGEAAGLGGGPGGQDAGGGVYNSTSNVLFEDLTVFESSAQVGGGLYVNSGVITLTNSGLISNTATQGGGLYNNGGTLTVANVVLATNAAATGGGYYQNGGLATLLHLTAYANTATGNGGGIFQSAGSITIRSSIFQSNSGASGPAIFISGTPNNIDYNYYHDHASNPVVGAGLGANSVNNNLVPPGMIDPANGDYHLADTAAAIDIADPNSPVFYDFDLDPRPSNQGFDMGADELAGCYARVNGDIYGSIQLALQMADPGDQIDVAGRCVGVHSYNAGGAVGVISTTVHITKNVILLGGWNVTFTEQDRTTVIDALNGGYTLYIAPGITSTVKNFHLVHGNGNAPGLSGNGGAVYVHGASPQIMGNAIYSSTATNGSAIYVNNGTPTIGGNRVYSNTATNGSIHINNIGATTATVVNNFLYENDATNGAGVYHAAGAANIWHNDFINNNAVGSGGAVYVAAASPNIRNNILTGNTAGTTGGIRCNTGATPVINYNDYFNNSNGDVGGASCTTGANSLFVDPLFVNPVLGNYDLLDNSPLIDAGDPTMTLLVDYAERIRPSHQGWDIGAYELDGCYARNLADLDTIYGSVQWALGLAANGDTIEVDGTCLGVNTQLVSGNPITQNLFINRDITIDGNWNSNLPGGGDTQAILQPQGAGRVVYVVSGRVVTLTNIILASGNANSAGLSGHGGGVYNTGDLTLTNVTVRTNLAVDGAGIYNVGPLFVDGSFIRENTAINGGGVYNNYAGSTVITNTEITLNIATTSGAGIYQNLGTLQVEANQIFANVGSVSGGGVYQNSAVLRLLRNEIYNNSSSGNGGGIYLNVATGANQVYNNFIYGNQAAAGGGLYNATTNTGIWHNTFVGNGATGNNGGGLFSASGNPVIRNNIVQNSSGTGIHATAGVPSIGFNNVVGNSGAGYSGIASDSGGGIAQAPDYVGANNYRLQFGSPGIDVGDPASPVAVDIDGDTRPNNDEFDMGADEYNACLIRVGTAIFNHLQDAINYAEDNNIYTVEIARGECRGVRPDPETQTTLQVGYVRENLHFIGSLRRTDFSDPGDYDNPDIQANSTFINAEDLGRVIVIASPTATVTFTHVALVNGNAFLANDGNTNGGGLYNPSANVNTHEANICESQAADGGGYYAGAGASSYLSGASMGLCGVALVNDNDEYQGALLFSGNLASGNGGAIYNAGALTIRNFGLWVNSAGNHGGGIYNSSAAARLTNAIFYLNSASANGGGLYNTGNNLEIYHNTIRDNDAQNGGGLFNTGNSLILNSTIIYNNIASTTGGGLHSIGGTLSYNNFNQNSPNNSTIGEGTNAYLGDPGFALNRVFHLDYTSGNIDIADPTLISPPLSIDFDADLDSRPDDLPPHAGLWEYRSDIGADEYDKEFSCEILPENQIRSGAAGTTVFHVFAVYNDGTFTDTITVTLQSSSLGWATIAGGTQSYQMEPLSNQLITVTVSIPITATTNMADTSILTCNSTSIPANGDTATAVTQVQLIRSLSVEEDQSAFALPGDVLTFTHTITNEGNQTENVQIIPNSGPQFTNASLYNPDGTPFFPDTISMQAGEAISLLLRVTVFEDAMGDGVAAPGVVARLVSQPTIFDAAQDTITIGYVPGTRYVAANGAVDNSNCTNLNNPCATLQHAINQALDGDDILLSLGTYTDFVTRTVGSEVVQQNAFVDKDVSISGGYNAGDGYASFQPITNSVTLDGQGSRRIFYIDAGTDVTLMGLFMVNGRHPDFGGAIYHVDGNLTILGSWIRNSRAQYGAGLYHADGTLTVNSSVFDANVANNTSNTQPGEGAGIHIAAGTVVLENNTFAENRNEITSIAPDSTGNGGAIFQATGNITLLNNIFAFNTASGQGAAYYIVSPTVNIVDNDYSLFFDNGLNYANVPTGTNSFIADPLFIDSYYHLNESSPAVDTGTAAVLLGLDFDGEPRQQGIAVDRGADELTQEVDFAFAPAFQSAVIDSGERYTYTHVLTNTGDFADSYTLLAGHSTTGGTGWGYTFFPTSTGSLAPGASIQVTFVITGDGPGYVDTTVITATSAASSLSLAVTDETTITQIAGVDIEPPRTGSSVAGGTVNYTHTVTNTGDGPDSFDLTVADSNPPGWTISISPANTGVLLPGESTVVTVTIQVPAVVTVTVHTATIQATSVADPSVNDSVEDTTNLFIAGVELEPDYFTVVDAGTLITYVHTLTNTGNVSDTFDLTATSSLGWLVSYEPVSVTLDVLETAQVTVVISVPVTALAGEQDDTEIVATSTFNPLVSDSVLDQTRVTQNHGLTFTPDQTRTVPANTTQVYTHTLTNTGDGPDTFAITANSSQGWVVQTPSANITLDTAQSATVMVTLTVPVVGPVTDTMQVTATSVISPAFYAVVTNTTIVTGPIPVAGVDIEPDRSGSGLPGTQQVYQHTVTNTGNITDTFMLTFVSSEGWGVVVTPVSVTLGTGQSETVQVTVDIPGGATPGTIDLTTVTATSVFDAAATDTITDTTTVSGGGGTSGVLIGPDNSDTALPGDILVYQHVITNTGTASDNYDLTVLSSQGWTVDVGPDNVTLGSGLTSVVVVTVTVPGGATPGTVDLTTVTATSTISPTVSDNATDTTTVLADGAGVSIGPDNAAIGVPGTDVVYTHRITNTGNAADFFSFNITSSQGWDVLYDPTFASLAAGESAPVTITVSVPAAATPGTVDVTTIFATSSNDPTVQDTATDTTTVEGTAPSGNIYLPIIYTPCIPTGVDLVVTALEIVPANPQAGQTVTVRVTIRNQGTTSVTPGNNFYVDFYVDRIPGPVVAGDIQWGAQGSWMAAGASRTLSANFVFTGGTHQLWAQVDTDNTVNECPNENNNVLGPIGLIVTSTTNEPIPAITPVAPAPLDLPRPTPTPGAPDERDGSQLEVPAESGPITPTEQ
ncbi:MAG: right-handed parallel beta-helix repeat-containing protein [Chloroflexi bacterium]|nr:right-handed parallel beta-helix repeat-containing protein [Chloroflexota bacterium]